MENRLRSRTSVFRWRDDESGTRFFCLCDRNEKSEGKEHKDFSHKDAF